MVVVVYTCRKPQGKRCGFFLWDDDARRRAGDGVGGFNTVTATPTTTYNNHNDCNATRTDGIGDDLTASDLEIMAMDESIISAGDNQKGTKNDFEPRTPTVNRVRGAPHQLGLLTPVSGLNRDSNNDTGNGHKRKRVWGDINDNLGGGGDGTPSKRGKTTMTPKVAAARTVSAIKQNLLNNNSGGNANNNTIYPQTPPRQPQKNAASPFAPRLIDSQLLSSQSPHSNSPYSSSQSQSQSQSQPHQSPSQFRGTPVPTDSTPLTPTPTRFLPVSPSQHGTSAQSPSLASRAMSLLASHKTLLQPNARKDLAKLLDTHDLQLRGISKGRDISRVAVRKKDEQIQTLLDRIDVLETEREMWRASVLGSVDEAGFADVKDGGDDEEEEAENIGYGFYF